MFHNPFCAEILPLGPRGWEPSLWLAGWRESKQTESILQLLHVDPRAFGLPCSVLQRAVGTWSPWSRG